MVKLKHIGSLIPGVVTLILILTIILSTNKLVSFRSRAAAVKANLVVDARGYIGPLQKNWTALAQGGEESGVRMFENIVGQLAVLSPRYIRIDHIYDFYNVVSRPPTGQLQFSWEELDRTVCDIYRTGAKPFFALGYMPPTMSIDGTLIGLPKDWNEWSLLVRNTIEHYSGQNTRLCGGIYGDFLKSIYYEVWNEPDLETFGKWNIYSGKDYKLLYQYASQGATTAQNVQTFFLGGPASTRPYASWFQGLLRYINQHNLRIDFLSWHHYSTNIDDFAQDVVGINSWLAQEEFARFRSLPKVVSEWGFDSAVNGEADTIIGAAHTVAAVRNLVEQQVEHAFSFEAKDGINPSWGILTRDGKRKPRYFALLLLNKLSKFRLQVAGEGTWVKALATTDPGKTTIIMSNYDPASKNIEQVPLRINNLIDGSYTLTTTNIQNDAVEEVVVVKNSSFTKAILMAPNSVYALELVKNSPTP